MPLLLGLLPRLLAGSGGLAEVEAFVSSLPDPVLGSLPRDPVQRVAAASLLYLVAPLYLVVPLLVATVIAADSFAGERERGTLELLLHAPVTDAELFVGKVAAAWGPAAAVGVLGYAVYGAVGNLVTGAWLFPNALWTALALWVAPAVSALGLGVTVLISSHVRGFQEASQLAGLIVLPLLTLLVAQGAGVLLLSPRLAGGLGGVTWALAGMCLLAGARTVDRPRLGARR